MMIRKFIFAVVFVLSLNFKASAGDANEFYIDLVNVVNDKVQVTLTPPDFTMNEVIYRIPKVIPGTYSIYNFGRFIQDFKVYDKSGNEMPFEKSDVNSWKIENAANIGKISYWVEDTFDASVSENFVFEPAGTNIDKDEQFILNNHGFFGYFEGRNNIEYKLKVKKPEGFYGSTALVADIIGDSVDVYTVKDYFTLVDSPIMYNIPDTTILNIGGAEILVSVYAQDKVNSSKNIAKNIKGILEATKEYLEGTLPIEKYAFLFYFHKGFSRSGGDGALEHNYSSIYSLPDISPDFLSKEINHVTAHEFLHIITPLSIHSEEIANFDYNNPEMSKHLWLYEGVTEYASNLVQVQFGVITPKEFLEEMRSKIIMSKKFDDTLPFTELSKDVLTKYKDQYLNVYMKGALIGMAIDIKLRLLTKGRYGLPQLMTDLSKKFGRDKPFKDDELFDVIAELSHPEIREFFRKHVEGSELLPYGEIFELAGLEFKERGRGMDYSLGGLKLGVNPLTNRLMITSVENLDSFGRSLGFKEGDEITKFNREEINLDNFGEVINNYFMEAEEGDDFEVEVIRKSASGVKSKVVLKSRLMKVMTDMENVITIKKDPSPEQLVVRNSWLNIKD